MLVEMLEAVTSELGLLLTGIWLFVSFVMVVNFFDLKDDIMKGEDVSVKKEFVGVSLLGAFDLIGLFVIMIQWLMWIN